MFGSSEISLANEEIHGTVFVKYPGANVLELPLDQCRTFIESWADFEQNI